MKHLKEYINESILSSVNAGKQGIIEKWCEEHMLNFNKSRFELSSDNRIDYGKNTNYVEFGMGRFIYSSWERIDKKI